MKNQYEVLGKAPEAEDLKKLSNESTHLTIKNLSAGYCKMEILHNFDLFVGKAQSFCLIGPNGSGKTTLFNSIVGTYPIDQGSIKFNGKEVSELPVPIIAKLGLLRTFQQTRIYGKLNCVEICLLVIRQAMRVWSKYFHRYLKI